MNKKEDGVTLVELLVVMIIMTIVSGMIITVWFSLNNAQAFSSTSDEQQGFARDAMSRMASEIRDAQAPQNSNTTPFVVASPTEVDFYTTYNTTGASDPTSKPTLARFILRNGAIYREEAGADKVFGTSDDASQQLVGNVVNQAQGRDLFTYWAFDANGKLQPSTTTTVLPSAIVDVTITLLVDLNPGHSPAYMTAKTTVQPRNVLQL